MAIVSAAIMERQKLLTKIMKKVVRFTKEKTSAKSAIILKDSMTIMISFRLLKKRKSRAIKVFYKKIASKQTETKTGPSIVFVS